VAALVNLCELSSILDYYIHCSKVSRCGEVAWRQGSDTRAAQCPFHAGVGHLD